MSDARSAGGDQRPIDPATRLPIGPWETPGYYPNYHTLGQQKFWDATTRNVVLKRVHGVPPIRFFDTDQARLMEAISARIIPQDDRDDAHRIPIVPGIDERLFEDRGDGYRYENMPPDREAYVMGLKAIDRMAHERYGDGFTSLGPPAQEELLKSIHDGKPYGAHELWEKLPAHRFWMLLVGDCAAEYYAHPFAWDEIGFGGPAYPRAYMRLERGQAEPWEVNESRYEWEPPDGTLSGGYEPVAGQSEHYGAAGQGGTH
jgi:hypothetical protein